MSHRHPRYKFLFLIWLSYIHCLYVLRMVVWLKTWQINLQKISVCRQFVSRFSVFDCLAPFWVWVWCNSSNCCNWFGNYFCWKLWLKENATVNTYSIFECRGKKSTKQHLLNFDQLRCYNFFWKLFRNHFPLFKAQHEILWACNL